MLFVCVTGHLAQLDRALASEAKGRRFESCNAHSGGLWKPSIAVLVVVLDVVAGSFCWRRFCLPRWRSVPKKLLCTCLGLRLPVFGLCWVREPF